MCTLTKNQVLVLKHLRQGKKPSEICKMIKRPISSVYEARNRAKRNIALAIGTLQFAVDNNYLDEKQIRNLKRILGKV
jgi:transcriptional regulator